MAQQQPRVALVTGGSRGIGKASVLALARRGFDVAVNYHSRTRRAEAVADEVRALGRDAIVLQADVGDPEALSGLFTQVDEHFGRLDAFISNAAHGILKPAVELTLADYEETMRINAGAFLLGSQHAVRMMRRHGHGAIVGLSSLGSSRVHTNYAALGAAKAAMESIARYLAFELGGEGIRVNIVSGGPVLTSALKAVSDGSTVASWERRTPLGRVGEPADLGQLVGWLCDTESHWVTGQVLLADGGLSLQ